MEISRRAIVLAAGPGEFAGKPRPALIVQSDLFNPAHGSVTLLPITSVVGANTLFRVALPADSDTGLHQESEAQIDKIQSLRRHRIVKVIGEALRRWLAL